MAALRLTVSALLLGAVGFLCGVIAPPILDPASDQGAELGIQVTGPLAFLAGMVFGLIPAVRRMTHLRFAAWLAGLAAITFACTLYLSWPDDRWRGFVVDGEVSGCQSAASVVPAAERKWRAFYSQTAWLSPRPGWEAAIRSMLQNDHGVVVTLDVRQRWDVYEQRKPWNRGRLVARRSREPHRAKYFARAQDCLSPQLARGHRSRYAPEFEGSVANPPDILPTFLDLYVLRDVPARYQRLIGDGHQLGRRSQALP